MSKAPRPLVASVYSRRVLGSRLQERRVLIAFDREHDAFLIPCEFGDGVGRVTGTITHFACELGGLLPHVEEPGGYGDRPSVVLFHDIFLHVSSGWWARASYYPM